MDFKELMEKYKSGTASPEDSALIAEEIERFECINDYLSEGIEAKMPVLPAAGAINDTTGSRRVRKTIARKFILTTFISVAIVAVVVLSVFYGVSPLMNKSYYQPLAHNPTIEYDGDVKLFIDMSVYTELHFPGVVTNWVSADPLGFGNYDVQLSQWDYFRGVFDVYAFGIERGKIKNLPIGFYQNPISNAFRNGDPVNLYDDDPNAVLEIEKLPETAEEKAYISFKDDIPIESVYKIMAQQKDLHFSWVAVRSGDRNKQHFPLTGFEPNGSGPIIEKTAVDQSRYPYLDLGWVAFDPNAKTAETHFESLLKYMTDNGDFRKLLGTAEDFYANSLSYVEANGVKSYGCLVIGHGKEILALRSLPEVDGLYLDDVKVSSYAK